MLFSKYYFHLLRIIYTILLSISLPLILIKMLLRSYRAPDYRKRILERFACINNQHPQGLWIHAVSVGESVAAIQLIKLLMKDHSQLPITITSITPTGSRVINNTFGEKILNIYLPYDLPWLMNKFLKKIRPQIAIIMETERWPNMLISCHNNNIPVILANARLSTRSAKRYKLLSPAISTMLAYIDTILAQTTEDKTRFINLGYLKENISITGNMKFDITITKEITNKSLVLRKSWGENRIKFIAASTHNGEEELLLESFRIIREKYPEVLLIIVPRHPERFNDIGNLIKKKGFKYIKRSSNKLVTADTAVVLGDTMGELNSFYGAADIAFVGGSLVPIGGHNILEPAIAKLPIITGSNLQNCEYISQIMCKNQAMVIVNNSFELADQVINWLRFPSLRTTAGEQAYKLVLANQGATNKIYNIINKKIIA